MITSIICSLLVFLVIYLGIIKGIPKLANNYGWITPTLLIFLLIITTFIIISINKSSYINLDLLSTTLVSILLVIVGFSTYSTIFIRASQEPRINENSPNTLEEALSYMNRDQYGDWSILDRGSTIKRDENIYWQRYTHDKANPSAPEIRNFVFDYQINEMYLRYFAWQFIGKEDYVDRSWDIRTLDEYYTDLNNNGIWDRTEKFKDINGDGEYSYGNIIKTLQGINWFRYGIPLAFLFGLAGMGHHFYNDRKRAFALLILFLATGLMIIVYLNQYDPQPRERDYSYVGSFFVFSIWISIGVCGLLELLERITKLFFKSYLTETSKIINRLISVGLISIIFLCMPFTMMVTDYNEHDRTGNYVAWDYAYNLLNSCGPNGILFTNGDNDTFPLWYLQEVENVRKDVRVVNLSLLNTPWYIDQLKNQEPKINIDMLDDHIEQLDPINGTAFVLSKWTDQWTEIKIRLEEYFDTQLHQHYSIKDHGIPVEWSPVDVKGLTLYDKEINLELKPSISNYLKLQDIMILEILDDLENNRPIYFAVTVAPSNRMGLEKYLEMEGLVYKITNIEDSNWDPHYASPRINFDKMHSNITETNNYDFIIKTPEEYNASILNDSGIYRYTNLNSPSVYFNNNIMRLVQNYRSGFLQLTFEKLYSDSAQVLAILDEMETYFPTNVIPVSDYQLDVQIGRIYAEAGNKEKLRKRLNRIQLENPSDLSANFLIANIYISDLGDVEKAFDIYLQLKEKYPRVYEVRHELIKIYSSQDKIKEAIAELENYLITEPNHPQASEVLKYLKERL